MAQLGLFPNVRLQEFDNFGKPLTGGFIYSYESGTDTPLTLYHDSQGLVEHDWPLVLDDAGSAKIYLLPAAYKIVIKDQFGVLIEERDPVYSNAFVGGTGAGGTWGVVANYDALRNLTQPYDAVYVLGRNTANDGGQGIFVLDQSNTDIDDDGTILVRATTDRYVRNLNGYIEPAWFGCVYDSAIDNGPAFTKTADAGIYWGLPVNVNGSLYFGSNYSVASGVRINLNGALTGPNGIVFTFKSGSVLLSATTNSFASAIQPSFEQGVCDEMRYSWFGGGFPQIVASTSYSYRLTIDKNAPLDADLTIPANFEVNFIAGSKLIVSSAANISIVNLAYEGTGTIIQYQDKSYIGTVNVGSSYCYLEWFGGVAGTALDTDNLIAFHAAMAHGRIYLISLPGQFYNIPADTYANTAGLVLQGNYIPNNSSIDDAVASTIRLSTGASISTTKLTTSGIKIDGSGSITATESSINNSMISNAVSYSTGLSAINDTIGTDPQYVAVGSSGKVIFSSAIDGTWEAATPPTFVTINSVCRGPSIYVAVGGNGLVMSSVDADNWTIRTSGVTATMYKVKWIAAVSRFVAVGDGGKVLYSTDGISWNNTQVATSSLRGITYFNSRYVVTGTNGDIYTSLDMLSWTKKVVTNVTTTLYDVDSNDTSLVIVGASGTLVTSTDAINFSSRIASTSSSLLTVAWYEDSSIWVIGGTNTTLMTSNDGISFAVVDTYTGLLEPINAQTKVNGQYVFALGSGYVMSSFDLASFSASQPVNAVNLSGIAAKPSFILAIGAAGAVAMSLDGTSYTAQTPAITANLNRIKQIGSTFFIVGDNGTYLFSLDGLNWTVKSVGSTSNLSDIVANEDESLYTVVGSAGFVATSPNAKATSPSWTVENIYITGTTPLAYDIKDVVYNATSATNKYMLAGKSGTLYRSADAHTWTKQSFGTTDLRMAFDGTLYWVVDVIGGTTGALYKSTTGIGFSYVDTPNTKFSRITILGSSIVLFGWASTSSVFVSSDAAATWSYNTLTSIPYTLTAVSSVTVNGNEVILYATSNGRMLNGTLAEGSINLTEATISNSIIDIPVVNTIGGTVSSSQLLDITYAGKIVDTSILRFTGNIGSMASRCDLYFTETIGVLGDAFISDSSITNVSNEPNTGVFNVAAEAASLSINNTIINAPSSMLTYSEDTDLVININGGVIHNGNVMPLTNGFAKVFTNGVFDENAASVRNITAYVINGNCLEAELTPIETAATLTSSEDHWHGNDLAKVVVEGDHFKVTEPLYLAGSAFGSEMRYRFRLPALNAMRSFGGRIKLTIKYPTGADKSDQLRSKVKALFYIPSYTVDCYDYDTLTYRNAANDDFQAGKVLAGSSSVDGATIINYTNVWSGRENLNQQLPVTMEHDPYRKNVVYDIWHDYEFYPYAPKSGVVYGKSNYLFGTDVTYTSDGGIERTLDGNLTFEAYIVVVNESIAPLPVGTTIKVELIPSLPKTLDTFQSYFEAPQLALDPLNGREVQFLQFRDFSTGDLNLAFRMVTLSQTWDEADYTASPNFFYNFTPPSGPAGQFAATYQPASKLHQINKNVKISIENMFWTGAQTVPVYHYRGSWETDYYNAMQTFT